MGSSKEQVQELVSSNERSKVRFSETEQKALEAVEAYLDGREQLLSPPTEGSGPAQPVRLTEDWVQSLKLQAERLQMLDINMEIRNEWQSLMRIGKNSSRQPEFYYDGEQLVGRLRSQEEYSTVFRRNWEGIKLGTFQEHLQKDYYVRKAEDGSFQIAIENVLSQAEVYDHSCDYWDGRRWLREKLRVAFSLFCLVSLGLTNLISLAMFGLSVYGIVNSDVLGPAFILWVTSAFGVVPLALYGLMKFPSYRRRKASAGIIQRIRSFIPEFCINDFVSMAQNRIKSIFFADSQEQVAQYTSCELHSFLLRYSYVVNCETMNFWFQDFGQDGNNRYIDVKVMVRLTNKEQGHKVTRSIQYVRARFARPINGIMVAEWYIEKLEVLKDNDK